MKCKISHSFEAGVNALSDRLKTASDFIPVLLGLCICSPCGVSAFHGTKEKLLEVKVGESRREKPLIECNRLPCISSHFVSLCLVASSP